MTLIKATLGNPLPYHLSLFKILKGVAKEIERLQCIFYGEANRIQNLILLIEKQSILGRNMVDLHWVR